MKKWKLRAVYLLLACALVAGWIELLFIARSSQKKNEIRLSASQKMEWNYLGLSSSAITEAMTLSSSLANKGHHRRAAMAFWQALVTDDAVSYELRAVGCNIPSLPSSFNLVRSDFMLANDNLAFRRFNALQQFWRPHARRSENPDRPVVGKGTASRSLQGRNTLRGAQAGASRKNLSGLYGDTIRRLLARASDLARRGLHGRAGMAYWQAEAVQAVFRREFNKTGAAAPEIAGMEGIKHLARRQFELAGEGFAQDFDGLMRYWPG